MKILLVGEYSRLHNSLKEGLVALGHQVTLIGDGDNFKNYPVDISIRPNYVNKNWFFRKLKVAFFLFTSIDLQKFESYLRFLRHKHKLKGYDVVQFINSNALKSPLFFQKKQVLFLKKHNKQLFLCACGTDTPIIEYLLSGKMRYHILTPYVSLQYPKKQFNFELKYISKQYKNYYSLFESQLTGIIPSDMDYYIPFKSHPKLIGLIPNPINVEQLIPPKLYYTGKIHIFLGINRLSYVKKGMVFFEEALAKIQQKYPNKVEVIIAESLPYKEYIEKHNHAHILLDQVYAYDQGYNALEAMAKGKVVFTGAEKEFLAHYGLQEDEVCINALPDVNYLVGKLSWLIENPKKIEEIGHKARKFIEERHDYHKVANNYLNAWKHIPLTS